MNTTGLQLVEHWTWAASKGLMNRNSAGALRAASAQVLGVLDNWEQIDVTSIDVEDVIRRFQNLRARDFNPESLNAYARRFRSSVDSFLQYVKDPANWKPATRQPVARPEKGQSDANTNSKSKRDGILGPERAQEPQTTEIPQVGGLIEYPFPLRDNIVARLRLPRDITAAEVKRLHGFMTALVVDINQS